MLGMGAQLDTRNVVVSEGLMCNALDHSGSILICCISLSQILHRWTGSLCNYTTNMGQLVYAFVWLCVLL